MICFGTHRVALQNHGKVRVYFLGDLHFGASATETERVDETVGTIAADDRGVVFLMGDLVDAISIDDKRFDPDELDPKVVPLRRLFEVTQCQIDYTAEKLDPIAPQIVAAVAGNHEDKLYKRHGGLHPIEAICQKLGMDPHLYTTQMAGWFNLIGQVQNSRISVPIAAHHGFGGGRTKGNTGNKLVQWAIQFPDARVVAMGHMHDPNVLSLPPYMRFRRERLHEQNTMLICAGAFMRSYPEHRSYVEMKGLPPKALACPYVEIEFFRSGHSRKPGFTMRGVLELEG